jgi:hypothetical protein
MEFLVDGELPPEETKETKPAAAVDMPLSLVDADYLEKISKIPENR